MGIFDNWGVLSPGNYLVEFLNGETRKIPVERAIVNTQGQILYLEDVDGKHYNWSVVISIGRE